MGRTCHSGPSRGSSSSNRPGGRWGRALRVVVDLEGGRAARAVQTQPQDVAGRELAAVVVQDADVAIELVGPVPPDGGGGHVDGDVGVAVAADERAKIAGGVLGAGL